MKELNKLPDDHHVEVPKRVWNQLDSRLALDKKKKSNFRLRLITGLAASMLLIVGVAYLSLKYQPHNPQMFATNNTFKSLVFEQLESDRQPMYNLEQLSTLNHIVMKTNPDFLNNQQ